MAIIDSLFSISGRLGDYTFYKVKGKTIMRQTGGLTKGRIKNGPKYINVRLNSMEFAGRVKGSKLILRALYPLRQIFDYSIAQVLHKPLREIQVLDTTNRRGQRSLCLSRYPDLLSELSLNSNRSLESTIGRIEQFGIEPNGKATIQIPNLVPGANLEIPKKHVYFRFCAVLSAIPDVHSIDGKYISALPDLDRSRVVYDTTPWLSADITFAGHTFNLVPELVPTRKDFAWMLALGVEFGTPTGARGIIPVKGEGAGRIIAVKGMNVIEG